MPSTALTTAPDALRLVSEWLREVPGSRFVLRIGHDAAGGLARLSVGTAVSPPSPASPAPEAEDRPPEPAAAPALHRESERELHSREEALRIADELLRSVRDRQVLVRTWLDVSVDVEVLTGVPGGQLLVRQFQLTGVLSETAHRAADGKCHLHLYARITRLESAGEASFVLRVSLVPETTSFGKTPDSAPLEVKFAPGQWDAHVISAVRLRARATGPHHLELRTTAEQVLWRLPLTVRDAGASGAAAASTDGGNGQGTASGGSVEEEPESRDGGRSRTTEEGDDPRTL